MKPDIVFKEVDCFNRQCDNGHEAPELFRRSGPGSEEESTKFFHVKGRGVDGIYCEPCLIIVNQLRKLKREGKWPLK